ncbi:hypothetical protein GCM10009111_02830 [Colwellia asteriadis]|jgi:hypothetical protein|uniref:Uncharacterized protein n=1 Tax=Colwellia asteriadis TaxID=517723 RepID=A0ABP3WBZ4_9GAMM
MKLPKFPWKMSSFLLVLFLLLEPEFIAIAVLLDGIGLEFFVLLLEVQAMAVFGYYFQTYLKPIVKPIYKLIQKLDPYFFIPTKSAIVQYPIVFVHAIPGFIMFSIGMLFVKFDSLSV